MTPKKALQWSFFWLLAACLFGLGIYYIQGINKASEFANVYIVEKLLSFDNLFVFLLIFNYFKVPDPHRRKVLNYGLAGAVVLRALFIGCGVEIVQNFNWILYGLGVLLIYSAYGVAFAGDDADDVSESKIIRFAKSFNIPAMGVWIIAVELSDIAFAIDSIPAALSISQDAFIVYSANIFAILGLRSFYFVIQSMYTILPQLKYGIGIILAFIGIKMLLPLVGVHVEPTQSLLFVVSILFINILAIIIRLKNSRKLMTQEQNDIQRRKKTDQAKG